MDRLLSMKVFQRVVDEGSFAAAARQLDMSPPVVTRLVADLEAHLGARLLQRSTRRLALTEAGQAYLGRVRHILQDIDEADAEVGSQTRELEGLLRLQATPVLASHLVAPLLPGFRLKFPKVEVDLVVDVNPHPPIENFDISLRATHAPLDGHLVARQVLESSLILVASPAYLQRRGQPATPQDLADHDTLHLRWGDDRSRTWHLWQQGDAQAAVHVEVQPMLSCNHAETLLRAALEGAGIAPVALMLVAPYLVSGELVPVLSGWISGRTTVYAAIPSRKYLPLRTRAFLDYLLERSREATETALAATRSVASAE